ncbi:MAG: hypothetical protein GQ582_13530, partial [Methyloprofundus sp.]|nr:hypothetical protein [Methyloprofundus sp.]
MQARKVTLDRPKNAKKRLFFWLLLFCLGISVPIYFLLTKVYSQLQDETWYRQRNQAELLVQRIERNLLNKLQPEQERAIAQYSFFNLLENQLLQSTALSFSPLSQLPPPSDIPGLIGYFQIDPEGVFHIPALPELKSDLQSGLSREEFMLRTALKTKLHGLLALNEPSPALTTSNAPMVMGQLQGRDNATKSTVPTKQFKKDYQDIEMRQVEHKLASKNKALKKIAPSAQAPQELSENELQELNITTDLWHKKSQDEAVADYRSLGRSVSRKPDYRLQSRKETVTLPDQSLASEIYKRNQAIQIAKQRELKKVERTKAQKSKPKFKQESMRLAKEKAINEEIDKVQTVRILSFESELSPLQLISLGTQHWCFYRNAWQGKTRYIQGFIVDTQFLQQIIQPLFNNSQRLGISSLIAADNGQIRQQFKTPATSTEVLIFRRTLLAPFQALELIVNVSHLSANSGKRVLDLISIALALIISTGVILFYRLGARQIDLAKQQRNFISSVSHELKTPLTSIRMYSEMLRSDWVPDESRKRGYYDYIYFESERLSRLISNVLQLAKLDHQQQEMQLVELSAAQLLQGIKAKTAAQIEASEYQLNLIPAEGSAIVLLDEDAFYQIIINLVDNALKFSKLADHKRIDIGYKTTNKGQQLVFYVRDYGAGVE